MSDVTVRKDWPEIVQAMHHRPLQEVSDQSGVSIRNLVTAWCETHDTRSLGLPPWSSPQGSIEVPSLDELPPEAGEDPPADTHRPPPRAKRTVRTPAPSASPEGQPLAFRVRGEHAEGVVLAADMREAIEKAGAAVGRLVSIEALGPVIAQG